MVLPWLQQAKCSDTMSTSLSACRSVFPGEQVGSKCFYCGAFIFTVDEPHVHTAIESSSIPDIIFNSCHLFKSHSILELHFISHHFKFWIVIGQKVMSSLTLTQLHSLALHYRIAYDALQRFFCNNKLTN